MASLQLFHARFKRFSPSPRSHAKAHTTFKPAFSSAHIFTCLCTACNAIKFLNSSGSSSTREEVGERKWNYKQILAAGEGLCVSAALVSQVSCLMHPQKTIREHLAAAPCVQAPGKLTSVVVLPAWQLIPLWLALFVNVVFRWLQAGSGNGAGSERTSGTSNSLGVLQRVVKLEENLLSSVNVIRALTRQVEKLGVRVQVTRRTLQDPIQKAATLAGSMCEAVKALSYRESLVEEELKEIERAMLAMQEQQAKQLDIIAELVLKLKDERKDVETSTPSDGASFVNTDYKYDYWTTN